MAQDNNFQAGTASHNTLPAMPMESNSVGETQSTEQNPVGNPQGTECETIVLAPGAKGCWNDQLNGELKPNTTYQVGKYSYQTDEVGRVVTVSGKLDLTKQDRNTYQQTKAGKTAGIKDGAEGDEGGHLIASIFNGPGEQINYAAMDGNLNKGAWKKMENDWAKAIKGPPPKNVDVKINAIYEGGSKRPAAFDVVYFIDGKKKSSSFINQSGG